MKNFNPFFLVPSGAPQNLASLLINSTSANISWEAPLPEEQNGEIVSYIIKIHEVETSVNAEYTSSNRWLFNSHFHPYYSYQVMVAAVTVGVGPFTFTFTFIMPEDGMTCMCDMLLTLVSV